MLNRREVLGLVGAVASAAASYHAALRGHGHSHREVT